MKIIGITNIGGSASVVVKTDSSLLNGRKPFFVPQETEDLRALPVIILRVSRLGKHIERRFADRYFDAVAPGLDIVDYSKLTAAKQTGDSWAEATCFDFSMPLGEWIEKQTGHADHYEWMIDNEPWQVGQMLCSPEEAIERISRIMTIRQGDMIYISTTDCPTPLHREQVILAMNNEKEKLYCKIK